MLSRIFIDFFIVFISVSLSTLCTNRMRVFDSYMSLHDQIFQALSDLEYQASIRWRIELPDDQVVRCEGEITRILSGLGKSLDDIGDYAGEISISVRSEKYRDLRQATTLDRGFTFPGRQAVIADYKNSFVDEFPRNNRGVILPLTIRKPLAKLWNFF